MKLTRKRAQEIRAAARATVEAPTSTRLERAERRMRRAAEAMAAVNAPESEADVETLIEVSDEWDAAHRALQLLGASR